MRALITTVLLVALSVACKAGPIQNLRLSWKGVSSMPRPSPAVSQSLTAIPISFGLRDPRPDPTAVGSHEEENLVVRTSDNVAQFAGDRIVEMLRSAGARLDELPIAAVEVDLIDFRVNEGGNFNGVASLRVTVRGPGNPAGWAKTYQGKSTRWGRTHSQENFNEALSNSLAEAVEQLLQDDGFAYSLNVAAQPQPQAPPAAPGG